MKLNPHLAFTGSCEEAFNFYQRCFGGELAMMIKWGSTPSAAQVTPEWQDKIIHARLVAGDLVLMGSDAPPNCGSASGGAVTVIRADSIEEAERVFNALADGGATDMPMAETFFAQRFGMLRDRFGTAWMVISERAACGASGDQQSQAA